MPHTKRAKFQYEIYIYIYIYIYVYKLFSTTPISYDIAYDLILISILLYPQNGLRSPAKGPGAGQAVRACEGRAGTARAFGQPTAGWRLSVAARGLPGGPPASLWPGAARAYGRPDRLGLGGHPSQTGSGEGGHVHGDDGGERGENHVYIYTYT